MKGMFTPSISWKLAWRNILLQRRQTILTIAAGSIGAALIMASIIFFQSFDESGNQWLKQHYGPIDWELVPPNNNRYFTSDEVSAIENKVESAQTKQLPVISLETSLSKVDGNLQAIESGLRYLGIGLDFTQTAEFDKGNLIWNQKLSNDEIILSEAIAKPLEIVEGDTVSITDVDGGIHLNKIKRIVKESGISGYRGTTVTAGTFIMSEANARVLAQIPDDAITSIFSNANHGVLKHAAPSYFPLPMPLFEVKQQKLDDYERVQQMKKQHGATFVLCSITAIFAGSLLMIQILLMLADTRQETTALLRAIGFRRSQTQVIFFIETILINVLSTGVGILLGIPLGFGVIGLFAWLNRDFIYSLSANSVPILPYISLNGILIAVIIVLSILTLTSLISCYKLGKLRIIPALRGGNIQSEASRSYIHRISRIGIIVVAGVIISIHSYQFASGKGMDVLLSEITNPTMNSMIVFVMWMLSSIASLYIAVQILPVVQKVIKPFLRKIGIGEVAQILAFRYPAGNYRRTFVITLLFSCCFMLLTLVVSLTQHFYRDLQQKSYTILGYPAYIKYGSELEKERIIARLSLDSKMSEVITKAPIMEPYMIRTVSDGVFLPKTQLNLTIPSEVYMQGAVHKLSERSSEFASDEEAWKAVLNNPKYVILDNKFSFPPEKWSLLFGMNEIRSRKINVGDKLNLNIYDKPAAPNTPGFGKEPPLVASSEIEVIGFVDTQTGLEFYNIMFVHPEMYDKLKDQGFRWESTPDKGYIMLPLASKDFKYLQEIEKHLVSLNIDGYYAPAISQASEDLSTINTLWIFNSFMILALGIGLAGLAILQFRAVQERSKTLAMMRCIGLSRRLIRQMLILEGTMIGWLGLLNGCVFGSTGGYILIRLYESTKKPTELALPFQYAWEIILPIVGCLMLITYVLNLAPVNRILQLSPSEAIRTAD